jgi:hypothetical protein
MMQHSIGGNSTRTQKVCGRVGSSLVVLCLLSWLPALWLHRMIARIDVDESPVVWLFAWPLVVFWVVLVALFSSSQLHARFHQQADSLRRAIFRASWVPFLVGVSYLLLSLNAMLSTAVMQLGLPMVLAWNLWPMFEPDSMLFPCAEKSWLRRWMPVLVLFVTTVIHGATGFYFTSAVGEHSGDEGHYLIQAFSLSEDGDLDIRNNFGGDVSEIYRGGLHISPNSIGGKWYSWHPPGLSFLLAPVVGAGLWVRHLVLGLFSGLSLCGLYLLAVMLGARIRHALLMVVLTGGSAFWGVYASRALPEVLGAALAVWGLYLVLLQPQRPWITQPLLWAIIGFLPWAHTRFLPVALVLVGAYGLHGLLMRERWPVKIGRLGLFAAGALGALLLYRYCQFRMFVNGSSYDSEGVLFSLPLGLWHSLASCRGILYMFPLFAFAFVALLKAFVCRPLRLSYLYVALLFLGVWLSACGTVWFTAGSCMPGRFLLVTLPPVLAIAAVMLRAANRVFVRGMLFAGMYSICIFVAMLSILPSLGRSFGTPHNLELIHPLYTTMVRFYYEPHTQMALLPALALYVGLFLLLLLPRQRSVVLSAVIMVLVVLAFVPRVHVNGAGQTSARRVAEDLDRFRLDKWHILMVSLNGETAPPRPIDEVINRFCGMPDSVKSVTTRDLGVLVSNKWISTPHIEPNDWEGRPYRWATIVPPFPAGKGPFYIGIEAEIEGDVVAHLVIREGSHTHVEKRLDPGDKIHELLPLEGRRRGDVYVLIRFEDGDGRFINHATSAGRYSEKLIEKNLILL